MFAVSFACVNFTAQKNTKKKGIKLDAHVKS